MRAAVLILVMGCARQSAGPAGIDAAAPVKTLDAAIAADLRLTTDSAEQSDAAAPKDAQAPADLYAPQPQDLAAPPDLVTPPDATPCGNSGDPCSWPCTVQLRCVQGGYAHCGAKDELACEGGGTKDSGCYGTRPWESGVICGPNPGQPPCEDGGGNTVKTTVCKMCGTQGAYCCLGATPLEQCPATGNCCGTFCCAS